MIIPLEEELKALENGASLENVLARRVEQGVAFLDARVPNWRKSIEIKVFDIGDSCRCVVGQVFDIDDDMDPSEYMNDPDLAAIVAAAPRRGEIYAVEFGFDHDPALHVYADAFRQYNILQELWKKELSR